MKKIFKNGLFEFAANTLYGERSQIVRHFVSIGAMAWKTGNETKTRGYQFQYNPLGWLTRAQYMENGSSNRYATRYWYNKMGNITAIQRKGLYDGGSYQGGEAQGGRNDVYHSLYKYSN